MGTEAIVPLKSVSSTKQRLTAALSEVARQSLVKAMAEDVLSQLRLHPGIDSVSIVCGDGWSAEQFADPTTRVWHESTLGVNGLNGVLTAALKKAESDSVLLIHGDLPFLQRDDITTVLSAASRVDVVLCSDQSGVGTNALLMQREEPMVLSFGERSFARHCETVTALGASWEALQSAGLATDIDTPEDLALLGPEAVGLGMRTAAWCRDNRWR
ncbi:2-phospho-L-lactate guanylyltransferase [Luminiphilus sp.]|jgi:2-phospho-L-lactate guanylyltransferase|nr:2-phospho-L-lactate guanylyltransferase [Luminiphilus sp.]MDB4048656.1 2-phospho-L-lactate guanylyltransferase [Luminiphilus sp.]